MVLMQQSAETEVAQSKTQWIEANIYLTEVARLQSIKDEADAAEAAKVAAAEQAKFDKAVADAVAAQLAPVEVAPVDTTVAPKTGIWSRIKSVVGL